MEPKPKLLDFILNVLASVNFSSAVIYLKIVNLNLSNLFPGFDIVLSRARLFKASLA